MKPLKIGVLLFPHVTALDLVGPVQVFAAATGAEVYLVWKDLAPVPVDSGYCIVPTATLETCPQVDLLCVPGGPGQVPLREDAELCQWLRRQGDAASWVTSVCTGSLLLGAAGLLKGYRAASHWNYREHLTAFGAIPDTGRVVQDRNRITGGGCTAGIDFALQVVAHIFGEQEAKEIQLFIEYAPQPPFNSGRPEDADELTVDRVKNRLANLRKALA
ncbi:DJ-1/PfpI family protein [Noviherbaspirillum denitrificans]|uniref:DJ-1/PfpI domain-containing protein n=1 Tax=Noviherbaspirillum denitrificans TaxID=1968433 RepID=A0A254TEM9_9BURK|nr:DJ-1/PfpI family protein [Noviherbaspirillum denitrificans]OWW21101.1 hypothetical protein AYR66_18085 [Noviherbaspirillum denitrificans]